MASAIRELINAYAHCADRRDANGRIRPFTEDTLFTSSWIDRSRPMSSTGALRLPVSSRI